MSKITKLGAFELAHLIREKEISPVDVIDAFIAQAEDWQPTTNAIVEDFFEEARAEAVKKEKMLSKTPKSELPPLHGVPFSTKEMLAVKGAKRTAGNIYYKDSVSPTSATVIERFRQAGGILVGTTNVPELGFWFETENVIYGRTNNPHNPKHACGGSSGGEGALVSSRGSAFGIGSDIGGSIRIPASFCGIFGHKPSSKLVPLTGHFPFSNKDMAALTEDYYPYTTIGPFAYKAEDLHGLLKIMSGPDGIDPQTRSNLKIKPLIKDISDIEVYSLPNPVIFLSRRADKSVISATEKATSELAKLGCKIRPFPEDFFLGAVELWFKALKSTKQKTFNEALAPGSSIRLKEEFFKLATFNANHTFPSLVLATLEKMAEDRDDDIESSLRTLREMRSQMAEYLGPKSVLILPVHPRPAPSHHSPYFSPFDFIYAGIINVMELPATACPISTDDKGLPTGVQIVASHGNDHLSISVAAALEEIFGGSIPLN